MSSTNCRIEREVGFAYLRKLISIRDIVPNWQTGDHDVHCSLRNGIEFGMNGG